MQEKIKNWLKNNWFKILAILFLLGALAGNSYGYYQFLRWLILGVGGYSAYLAYNSGRKIWAGIVGVIVAKTVLVVSVFLRNSVHYHMVMTINMCIAILVII